jgi:hypothetical protein
MLCSTCSAENPTAARSCTSCGVSLPLSMEMTFWLPRAEAELAAAR